MGELGTYLTGLAGKAAMTMFSILLTTFFTVVTTYFMLRRWAQLGHWAQALLPLRPAHTRKLVRELRTLGRQAMLGTLVLGVLQGGLAAAGYFACGAPQAGFFGALTAVASTLPALGTFLVWAPIGAYLIGTGHAVAGVVELLWGFFVVVMLSDGIIRPKLVGQRAKMGALSTLVGLFGGLEMFGFIGLMVGPTLVGISLATLRLFAEERSVRRRVARRIARRNGFPAPAQDLARAPEQAPATASGAPESRSNHS
jgi:predicted PurR-regulated permease PerM